MLSQVFLPFSYGYETAFGMPRPAFFVFILPQTTGRGNFPINAFFVTFVRTLVFKAEKGPDFLLKSEPFPPFI